MSLAAATKGSGGEAVFVTDTSRGLWEHNLDFGPPLEWARAIREQVDWPSVRARTSESPFAKTFLYMLDQLGVVPHADTVAA